MNRDAGQALRVRYDWKLRARHFPPPMRLLVNIPETSNDDDARWSPLGAA